MVQVINRISPSLPITPELAPWCNEIHVDNPNCPMEIRACLIRREEQFKVLLQNKNNQKGFKSQKPRNEKGKGRKGGK